MLDVSITSTVEAVVYCIVWHDMYLERNSKMLRYSSAFFFFLVLFLTFYGSNIERAGIVSTLTSVTVVLGG